VAVDFYATGDLMKVVRTLNGLDGPDGSAHGTGRTKVQ